MGDDYIEDMTGYAVVFAIIVMLVAAISILERWLS